MNKNEALHPEVLESWRRGKIITDARIAEQTASREAVIKQRINDIQAKLDSYLKPKNATKAAR